jgi:hypothetical protein
MSIVDEINGAPYTQEDHGYRWPIWLVWLGFSIVATYDVRNPTIFMDNLPQWGNVLASILIFLFIQWAHWKAYKVREDAEYPPIWYLKKLWSAIPTKTS